MNTALEGKPLLLIRICAVAYLAVVFYVLLQPFNFFWPFRSVANSAQWRSHSGITFGPSGMLISSKRPTALYRSLETAKGLTIELWLKSGSVHQDGPARIISYSLDRWQRNFTVGQDGHRLICASGPRITIGTGCLVLTSLACLADQPCST